MNKDEIEIGDKVSVVIVVGQQFDGFVKHIPSATGDSWVIRECRPDKEIGVLHYVQTFAEIIKYDAFQPI